MLEPLRQWICDKCGDVIEKPEHGYLVLNSEGLKKYDFEIIHIKCDDASKPQSGPIEWYLGEDGRERLLSWLSIGPIKMNIENNSVLQVKDMDGFVDFFRRVQTPYYEEARTSFHNERLLDDYADANEYASYLGDRLKSIIKIYE